MDFVKNLNGTPTLYELKSLKIFFNYTNKSKHNVSRCILYFVYIIQLFSYELTVFYNIKQSTMCINHTLIHVHCACHQALYK